MSNEKNTVEPPPDAHLLSRMFGVLTDEQVKLVASIGKGAFGDQLDGLMFEYPTTTLIVGKSYPKTFLRRAQEILDVNIKAVLGGNWSVRVEFRDKIKGNGRNKPSKLKRSRTKNPTKVPRRKKAAVKRV